MATIARVTCTWAGVAGSPAVGTFHFFGSAGQEQDMADAVGTFVNECGTVQASSVTWSVDDLVTNLDSNTGNVVSVVSVDGGTGTASGGSGPLPRAVNGLIEWRTGTFQGGREIRGRTNIPWMAAGTLGTGGTVSTGTQASLAGAADALIADASTQLVVWSRTTGATPSVTLAGIWNEFAVLRSRRD